MERYQVILAYAGSHFKGYQRQAKERTVQSVVEAALRNLSWQGKTILAAGRTDTGAHATGQVIAFDLDWKHGVQDLQLAMNRHLPSDVSVMAVRCVRPSFHPRYDAEWRRYIYRIYCQPVRNPLLEPYAWRVWPAVELNELQTCASLFPGEHDFNAFGAPLKSGGNTIRRVISTDWMQEPESLRFEIVANAFLYHMVRRVVFMQVMVAQGMLPLAEIKLALHAESNPGEPAESVVKPTSRLVHGLAPAHGLVLAEVHYPPEAIHWDEDNQFTNEYVTVD